MLADRGELSTTSSISHNPTEAIGYCKSWNVNDELIIMFERKKFVIQ